MVPRGTGFAALLLLTSLASAGSAVAEEAAPGQAQPQPSPAELASARRLFHQALAHEDRGRWAEALGLYQRVSSVAISPSVRYHMAVCHEELGHLVEAVNAYELAVSAAEERRDVALARESRRRLEKLRARVPTLTVAVPEGAEGVQIELDGEPLNAALAGTPVLIDPGARRLSVRSESHERTYEITLQVAPGEAHGLHADLGPKKAPRAPKRVAVRPRPGPPPLPPEPSRMPGFIAGGAALALAAGAVATGVAAYGVREDYLTQNADPAPGSRDDREALRSRGQALAITSTGLSGGALVAAGLATWLLWPSSSPAARPSATITPWIGPAGAGLGVGGAL